jgi:hypothetical protein
MSHRFDEVRHSGVQFLCSNAGEAVRIYQKSEIFVTLDLRIIPTPAQTALSLL